MNFNASPRTHRSRCSAWWAAAIVIVLTLLNVAGLRASARTQNVLTVIEVAGLAAVVVAGFYASAKLGMNATPRVPTRCSSGPANSESEPDEVQQGSATPSSRSTISKL